MKKAEEAKPAAGQQFTASPALMATYREAEVAVQENAETVIRLAGKIGTLSASIPGLAEAVEQAGKAKAATLEAHAVDQATASELSTARNDHDAATKAHTEALELLAAVEKAHGAAVGKVPALNDRKAMAARRVWQEIHTQAIEEIRATAGPLYLAAEVAAGKLGSAQGNPFTGSPLPRIQEKTREIERAIFG